MSEFKDFLDQIKIRLTNPLIFSFLISWVIIHWQIFVGGFYLSPIDLEEQNYSNFLEFIAANVNWWNGLIYPLCSAIVYTILSPPIRIGIQLFNTWINKFGNNQIRKVATDSFIPYEMYDKLLEEVQLQRQRNESLITENIGISKEIDVKKNELRGKGAENENLQSELTNIRTQLSSLYDSSFLDGIWKIVIKKNNGEDVNSLIVRIKSNEVEERQKDGHYHHQFYLLDFVKNQSGEASFLFKQINSSNEKTNRHIEYFNQIKENGKGRLSGRYNDKFDVIFDRLADVDLEEPLLTKIL